MGREVDVTMVVHVDNVSKAYAKADYAHLSTDED